MYQSALPESTPQVFRGIYPSIVESRYTHNSGRVSLASGYMIS